jgi:hypothetical protein
MELPHEAFHIGMKDRGLAVDVLTEVDASGP